MEALRHQSIADRKRQASYKPIQSAVRKVRPGNALPHGASSPERLAAGDQ